MYIAIFGRNLVLLKLDGRVLVPPNLCHTFQEMKLYEAFGESAPQAALQIAIILQLGYITPLQIFTISTSLISFGLGASEVFLMMGTKNREIKNATWKETWFLVFPAMLIVVVPR